MKPTLSTPVQPLTRMELEQRSERLYQSVTIMNGTTNHLNALLISSGIENVDALIQLVKTIEEGMQASSTVVLMAKHALQEHYMDVYQYSCQNLTNVLESLEFFKNLSSEALTQTVVPEVTRTLTLMADVFSMLPNPLAVASNPSPKTLRDACRYIPRILMQPARLQYVVFSNYSTHIEALSRTLNEIKDPECGVGVKAIDTELQRILNHVITLDRCLPVEALDEITPQLTQHETVMKGIQASLHIMSEYTRVVVLGEIPFTFSQTLHEINLYFMDLQGRYQL